MKHTYMKNLLIFLFLLISIDASAQCIRGNCEDGYGVYSFLKGEQYVGEHQKGLMNGLGTFTWLSGEKYVG